MLSDRDNDEQVRVVMKMKARVMTIISRLLKLIKNGEISAERMKVVVFDTFQDSKFRS